MMKKHYLGVDIGGTFIKYAKVDEEFNIINKWKIKSVEFADKDGFYDYLCSNMGDLYEVESIGISAPGLIDKESNVKSYAAPNVRIMYGTNINNEVNKRTGKIVASINDAKSAGLCEFKIGNAKGSSSSAFLIIGTGTGGCVCDSNGVVFGKDSFAGEFHHLAFMNLKTKQIDRLGDYASITALVSIYNSKVDDKDKVEFGSEVTFRYKNGEEKAIESVEDWMNNIIVQLITMTTFYNPEVICIGGGISEEDWFINLLKEKYKEKCIEFLCSDVITTDIRACKYNNDANIFGAIINVKS